MSYTAKDIETLEFKDAVRKRIEMYMGSADNQGILQCIREIISNSIDEYSMGYGDKIKVELFSDNKIRIVDWGRGCPFGKREDGTEAMEAIFMSAHSGGKFNEKTYQSVIGMNGIGAKGVALSSLNFIAKSKRNGEVATLILDKGNKISFDIQTILDTKSTGTSIEFIPDPEVYHLEKINIDFNEIKSMCKNWSFLNKNLKFELINHITNEKINYISKNGILDLIKEQVNKPIHSTPIYSTIEENGIIIEICCQWTHEKEKSYIFTNGLHNIAGGTSLTGAKTSITRTINNLISESLTGDLARTGLIYIVNAKVPNASFSDQTKTKVNNPELRGLTDKAFSEAIKNFFKSNIKESTLIEDFLTKELKAERAAEKARIAVLEQNTEIEKELKKKAILAGKLIDCRLHDETSELWLCEGKSAGTGIARARDGERIAIFPCRGKGLNVLKEKDLDKILKNDEYKEIMVALGCGYGTRFNIRKLRYGKIVIASDADVDGYSIACLLLSFFYKFYPELIKEGKIFKAEFPLYSVVSGKKKYYAYNDDELSKLPKGDIERNKG
jgi:DNA gyrase subunit B